MAVVARSLEIDLDHEMLHMVQALERYEMTGGSEAPSVTGGKPCRNPHACAMCTKDCADRMGE